MIYLLKRTPPGGRRQGLLTTRTPVLGTRASRKEGESSEYWDGPLHVVGMPTPACVFGAGQEIRGGEGEIFFYFRRRG